MNTQPRSFKAMEPAGGVPRRPWAVLLLLAIGCAGEAADGPKGAPVPTFDTADTGGLAAEGCEDTAGLSWDGFAWGFFLTYCNACHSAASTNRYGAPVGVDFDHPEDVERQSARIRARVIEEATMPLGGGVPPEALGQLEAYLCLIDNGG
jgi:hypothetical protein